VAYHRLLFGRHQRVSLLRAANLMAIGGVIAVAVAVTGAVLLVTSYVESGAPAAAVSVLIGALFAALWFAVPLARRAKVATRRWQGPPRVTGPDEARTRECLPAALRVGPRR
jgi:hypothetical protein